MNADEEVLDGRSAFAPAGLVDAGIRKDLRLDAPTAPLPRTPVLEK
jgi:hypothetical protein